MTHAPPESFRAVLRADDEEAVGRLVDATGVFRESEIAIARELVREARAKGEAEAGYHFLFADGAQDLDGYVCFGPIPGAVRRYELYWIAVAPGLRGSGLARRLQEATENAVRAMDGVILIAETSTRLDYEPARAFYRACGYALLADIPDWYDEDDGLAIYGKRL
jgi:ribosomal protein S18 acetylase RimI-like enzyme